MVRLSRHLLFFPLKVFSKTQNMEHIHTTKFIQQYTTSTQSPKSMRQMIREGEWTEPTSGICLGYLQANLVMMDKDYAEDFEAFCQNNPIPCPLLDVLSPGEMEAKELAPGSNVTTDVPKYHIYRNGILEKEVTSVENLWTQRSVTFLIGCSFSFEGSLIQAGVPVRNVQQNKNVSMFITSRLCVPSGQFSNCPLVVSYRPIPKNQVEVVQEVTKKFGGAHGPPIHIGNPLELGIKDLTKPDFGDTVTAEEGDVAAFWGCGVTATLAAISNPSLGLVVTHAPGHMFITDIKD